MGDELRAAIEQRVRIIREADSYSEQIGHASQLGFKVEQHAETILEALSRPAERDADAFREEALTTRDEIRARVMNRILTDEENAIWDMAQQRAVTEAAEVARRYASIGDGPLGTASGRARDIATAIAEQGRLV